MAPRVSIMRHMAGHATVNPCASNATKIEIYLESIVKEFQVLKYRITQTQ